jgi:hypothetical protein
MARIVDCVTEMESQWFFGRYGFVLSDAFPLSLIPCRGQLGFFSLEHETLHSVASAITTYDRAALSEAQEGRNG